MVEDNIKSVNIGQTTTSDIIMVFAILSVICFFVCLFVCLFTGINAMEDACEDVGGELSGSLDCRKGNEFYEIYPTNKWGLFNYTVNKYPKTE